MILYVILSWIRPRYRYIRLSRPYDVNIIDSDEGWSVSVGYCLSISSRLESNLSAEGGDRHLVAHSNLQSKLIYTGQLLLANKYLWLVIPR